MPTPPVDHTIILGETHDSGPIPSGRVSGRFTLGSALGRGGMGSVVAAEDREVGRTVALKQVDPGAPPSQGTMLIREARLQGQLDHPAIPTIYDLAADARGAPAFAMRRVTGTTLGALLAGRRLAEERDGRDRVLERLLRHFAAVCRAVDHAHRRGVAHCDLKPGNIMVDDDERVFVIDWGVATPFGGDGATPQRRAGGTLGYMAPEQLDATVALDGRVDVYALGAILFEILAGEPLHPRTGALLDSLMSGRVDARPSLRAPTSGAPAHLDRLCERACAHDRNGRPSTAGVLAEEIEDWLDRMRDREALRARAHDHLARARAALADPATRHLALPEAGRALALIPDDPDATHLVRDLMSDDFVPPEAAAELTAIEADDDRRVARAAAWSHLGFLLFPVTLLWQGHASIAIVIATIATWAVLEALALAATRGVAPRWWAIASLVCIVGQSTMYARYLGPFVLTPALASLACTGALMHPRLRRPALVIALAAAGPLVPYLLELSGVLRPTVDIDGDLIALRSHVSALDPSITVVTLLVVAIAIQGVGAVIGLMIGRPAHAARRRVAAQAWHLEQLVGTASEPPP